MTTLGVDFGTTNSTMARFDRRRARAEVLRDAEGQDKTPSVVFFGEEETLVGTPAENLLVYAGSGGEVAERLVQSIKRELHSPVRIALPDGRAVAPVEVAAEILRKLRRDAAQADGGGEPERVVLTQPAVYESAQSKALLEAATLAGFSEVELVEEPVAAALAFEHAGGQVGRGVLVYDFGGGTFDAAFVVREEAEDRFYLALEPAGDPHLGGDDLDGLLYEHFDAEARQKLGRPIGLSEGAVDHQFLRQCRRRKENLSKSRQATFSSMPARRADPDTAGRSGGSRRRQRRQGLRVARPQ